MVCLFLYIYLVLVGMTEVDVFISNYTLVDPEIYQLWIEGNTGMFRSIEAVKL